MRLGISGSTMQILQKDRNALREGLRVGAFLAGSCGVLYRRRTNGGQDSGGQRITQTISVDGVDRPQCLLAPQTGTNWSPQGRESIPQGVLSNPPAGE